ncbi:MAG: capsule biosynthesis protein [Rhodobacterales bacterium]|nr:MAG: capsule biosynthesis protein [Rhodobacterales bacterium]
MTTRPKAARFFLRRVERPAPPPAEASADDMPFATADDGFGNQDFRTPAPDAGPAPRALPGPLGPESDDQALAAIAAEGLTGRQLRRARLLAQQHKLPIRSDLDAVLQLRRVGINPFARSSLLEVVLPGSAETAPTPQDPGPVSSAEPSRALARLPGDQAQLPQRAKPIATPSTEQRAEVNQAAEIQRMQMEIARRRRRKLVLLAARMFVFVLLPTIFAGWYYYRIATPIYATKSEFVIQQAGPSGGGGGGGGLAGLFSGMGLATSQDSIAVQGYLQSRDAMLRLEQDIGFRDHFKSDVFDPLQRLAPDATMEDAYSVYRDYVRISYDPSEGLIRLEVLAADPAIAAAWATQLISYAEEQVDHLTQRLRADQMKDAQSGYDEAQVNLAASQRRLIELQEKFKVLSSESEVALITTQIGSLESELTQSRLSLVQMQSNENPNPARMEPLVRRIATLEDEIASLRGRMTESGVDGTSLAQVQGDLLVAQADLQTRQLILAQALQSMETSRVEANRQTRYLSISVSPTPPDEAAYPRAFENTMVTLLILLGIYLMVSMTAAILREQVSA